jgi:hypothetical protein
MPIDLGRGKTLAGFERRGMSQTLASDPLAVREIELFEHERQTRIRRMTKRKPT